MTHDTRGASLTIIALAPVFYSLVCFLRLTRVACAQRGPLISVALPLYIAKTEQRLCTEILVKVTLQFSLLFGTHSNGEVKYMDIKEILYTNSLVIDFPKDDPEIMYENIDTCWSICSLCPSYLEDE